MTIYNLVADIGGTNSRFALCESGSVDLLKARKYPNKNFASLGDAIQCYLDEVDAAPTHGCLAVAGPAHQDLVTLTNIDWQFSVSAYRQRFGFETLKLTNDFTALAMSVPYLQQENVKKIGAGIKLEEKTISVLGPGTGLGVSGLLWNGKGWTALQGEGGNVDFSATTPEEIELLRLAQKTLNGHVRAEDLISGTGLSLLHTLRLEIHGKPTETLEAKDIAWRAKMSNGGFCHDTINCFCSMLGAFAGNQALTLGAFGGVYIGGGVAPQLEELFDNSPFRKRFEDKGRFTQYVSTIPTYIMLSHSRNALIGAAAMLLPLHQQSS